MPAGKTNNPNGRPKGAKNKLRRPLVEEIFEIAEELSQKGKGLRDCANENPKWFCETFLRNLIPKNIEVSGPDGGPIRHTVEGPIAEKLSEIYEAK